MHRTGKWKKYQDTVCWVDIQFAQKKGLKFYQTRSNAIILHDTLPACCISKAFVVKSQEIKYQKLYVSPRPPPNISYKENWMCDLDSDVAGSSKGTQRIEPKRITQLSSTVRPVCGGREEIEKRTEFDHDTLSHEKHDEVTDNKYGETRMWTRIHKALRVGTWTCGRRSNRYGELHIGESNRGERDCFQSTRTVTCNCERSRTSPSSRACEKDRKSSSSRSTSCRLAAD